MNKVVVLLVVLCLGLSSVAMAAGGYGGSYSDEAYQGFRAHLGYAWPGDLDSTIVYGGDYIWKSGLATVNVLNSDSTSLWTVEYSYLLRGQDDPSLYYGGGVGWASASNGGTDTGVLWNILLGKEFGGENGEIAKNSWFLEARYNLGSDLDGLDVDGLRVVGGWRF
jgi:hypothetical protein